MPEDSASESDIWLYGDAGNDTAVINALSGFWGSLHIDGGTGDDTLRLLASEGSGVRGGDGNDTLSAQTLTDEGWASGGNGNDVIEWANDADGGAGNDTVKGEFAVGGAGDDTVTAAPYEGSSHAYGGIGNDTVIATGTNYSSGFASGDDGDDLLIVRSQGDEYEGLG
jgi:hypothetical protein